jgi:SpoVK/Ycf46/Vps4 family AAA+-type ATPase
LPDSSSDHVLLSIQKFWESEAKFRRFGQIFKRGVLLWGPPGSGKTVSVLLLVEDLIQRGGIVVTAADPELTAKALSKLRQIEPKRNVICILEDIDELTDRYGEANLLSLLDGEEQIDNVVYLATTNYPERLDARLVNRPSRFDEVIKIGMPSAMARRMYIRSRLQVADLADADLQQWVEGTDGLSIAHIRELIAAVFCLGRDYAETLDRLRAMKKAPKSSGGNVIGMHPTKEAA